VTVVCFECSESEVSLAIAHQH